MRSVFFHGLRLCGGSSSRVFRRWAYGPVGLDRVSAQNAPAFPRTATCGLPKYLQMRPAQNDNTRPFTPGSTLALGRPSRHTKCLEHSLLRPGVCRI